MWFLDDKDKYATSNPRGRIIGGKAYFRDAAVPAPSKNMLKLKTIGLELNIIKKLKNKLK